MTVLYVGRRSETLRRRSAWGSEGVIRPAKVEMRKITPAEIRQKPLLLKIKDCDNMRITIEALDIQEVEKILFFLKSMNIKNIEVIPGLSGQTPTITKGDKKVDPRMLFGIWKDNPKSIEVIRTANWKRDWNA